MAEKVNLKDLVGEKLMADIPNDDARALTREEAKALEPQRRLSRSGIAMALGHGGASGG